MKANTEFFVENLGSSTKTLNLYLSTLTKSSRVEETIAIGEYDLARNVHDFTELLLLDPVFLAPLPVRARNRLIIQLLDHNRSQSTDFNIVLKVIDFLPQSVKNSRLKKLKRIALHSGNLEKANAISKVIGCELKEVEIQKILNAQINKGNLTQAKATLVQLNRGFSQEELLLALSKLNDSGGTHPIAESIEYAKLLDEVSKIKQLELCLSRYIENGMDKEARGVAELLGRDLTYEECESLVSRHVRIGQYAHSKKAVVLCKRKLSTDELLLMIEIKIRTGQHEDGITIIEKLPKRSQNEQLKKVLELSILKVNFELVSRIYSIRGKIIPKSVLKRMLNIAIESRGASVAEKMLEFMT